MPKVIINGKEQEAFVEETLLAAARKHKAHIGYACGGNGLCQTCDVVIEEGAENLSKPNDVEKAWTPDRKLNEGHRLACQAQVMKEGKVKLTTRAEKAKEIYDKSFGPEADTGKRVSGIGELFAFIGIETVEHVAAMPFVLINAIQRMSDGRLTDQAGKDVTEAWAERKDELEEIARKTTFGLSDAIAPLFSALQSFLTGLPSTLSGMFSGAGSSSTSDTGSESSTGGVKVQNLPVELVKKV